MGDKNDSTKKKHQDHSLPKPYEQQLSIVMVAQVHTPSPAALRNAAIGKFNLEKTGTPPYPNKHSLYAWTSSSIWTGHTRRNQGRKKGTTATWYNLKRYKMTARIIIKHG